MYPFGRVVSRSVRASLLCRNDSAFERLNPPVIRLSQFDTPGDAEMANKYEQPVNQARIVVLIAIALPVFGGLYYALLDFLLFG
jgi:hypothetical protein